MSFQRSLKQIQTLLQTELVDFFEKKRREVEKIHPELVSVVDQITDVTLRGGKRVRPFLCWLGYQLMSNAKCQMLNNKTREDRILIETMVGLELFHTFALIHDDIIDEDKVRRGGVTIHEFFSHDLRLPAGKAGLAHTDLRNHFGVSMAILAGDLALSWADERMREVARLSLRATAKQSYNSNGIATSSRQNVWTPRNDASMLLAYQQMKEQVILGQGLDAMRQFGFRNISQEKANELKTAWYSVVWPLTIGAILANAPQKDIHYLQQYGLLVGQAFQLRDDLMDGDITKKDFILKTKEYKRNIEQSINAFSTDNQRRKLMSDLAVFVVTRYS